MDYDLDAGIGAYTVSGISNAWDYDRSFDAAPASFAVAGNFPVNIDGYVKADQWSATKILALNDFSAQVVDSVSYWKLEAETGVNTYVTVPMQYFKATVWSYRSGLPFGGTNYAEVLVPAASTYAATINAAYSFRIKRFYRLPSSTFEAVFFNFGSYAVPVIPLTKEFTTTNSQDSCLIKGAFRLIEEVDGWTGETRVISGIRSFSTGGNGRRVVCSFDPIIQAGMMVDVDGDVFQAKTISFYVSPTDQYMEIFDYHV